MNLDRLSELTMSHFGLTEEEFFQTNKKGQRTPDRIVMPLHIFRAMASTHEHSNSEIGFFMGCDHSTVSHSKKTIFVKGQFKEEYDLFKAFVNHFSQNVTVIGNDGIERVTDDVFDERFYKNKDKVNHRTNNNYFPAYHFLLKLGSPEPVGLTKWRQDKGHFADHILERSSEIGSFVHDCIDNIIKSNTSISHDFIEAAFTNPKEAYRVKEALLGFMNFMSEEEPIILSSEKMMCGDDFAFTMDSQMLLKSDGYSKKHVVDWKTSKVANEDHKMQIEAMRRVSESDAGVVVVLGNSTKKKYTATFIKPSEQDYLWERFLAVKEVAYVSMLKNKTVAPRPSEMPSLFSLKDIKVRRKL